MTNDELEEELKTEIRNERGCTNRILNLINIAEARLLYLERGFESVFEWLTEGHGYSGPAAYRRIDSARLLCAVPEAEQKLESGQINLTNLAKAHKSIRMQEKKSGRKMTPEQKAEVVQIIENKTTDEADVALLEHLPETESLINREHSKRIGKDLVRLTLNFTNEDIENLAWIRDFQSHAMPEATNGELLSRLMSEFRVKQSTSAAEVKRAKNERRCCEYKDEKTGRVCGSTFQIEVDHIVPKALGGTDEPSNLRCLCRKHNRLVAEHWLGRRWANAWRKRRSDSGPAARDRPEEEAARPSG